MTELTRLERGVLVMSLGVAAEKAARRDFGDVLDVADPAIVGSAVVARLAAVGLADVHDDGTFQLTAAGVLFAAQLVTRGGIAVAIVERVEPVDMPGSSRPELN